MKKENHLAGQRSPYLLQHLYNPVDWYAWGDEAFAKALAEDKPVFLSIGYSTCHWCHVMERESFEHADVARIMNESFVAVKVDREERPDIDKIYMNVCQLYTGSGGWPLTVIMTPAGQPFFAGTYFPRESGRGTIGLIDLLERFKALWRDHRPDINDAAQTITRALNHSGEPEKIIDAEPDILERSFGKMSGYFDRKHGGFGGAPKFPSSHTILFLMRYWRSTGDETARAMAVNTLKHMRAGGIYDHVGFGFHRYSTDRQWLVPHFEKMLYDQAMLAYVYSEAYQAFGIPEFATTAREIFEYVLRDMTSSAGGFFSAEDADSEGREGRFYIWSMKEIREVLGEEDALKAADIFNVSDDGNFIDESTRTKTGYNIPHAGLELKNDAEAESIRIKLFNARENRPRPMRDDKILADWNGLMIAALAVGSRVLDDDRYLRAARNAVDFVLNSMSDRNGGLMHRYREGEVSFPGNIDDYAFIIWGLIELYEACYDARFLEMAVLFADSMIAKFSSESGFMFTPLDGERLIARTIEYYDGAYPSGNSVAYYDLVRLGRITGNPKYETIAHTVLKGALDSLHGNPLGHGMLLVGLQYSLGETCEIVLTGKADEPALREMISELHSRYVPHCVVLVKSVTDQADLLDKHAPFTVPMKNSTERTTAYVCRNNHCLQPVHSAGDMLELLGFSN